MTTINKVATAPSLHVSKPDRATGKGGGVAYVDFAGEAVSKAVYENGVLAVLLVHDMGHVAMNDIYMTATYEGGARYVGFRVKRDVVEGAPTREKAAAAKPARVPYVKGGQPSMGAAGPVKTLTAEDVLTVERERMAREMAEMRAMLQAATARQPRAKKAG